MNKEASIDTQIAENKLVIIARALVRLGDRLLFVSEDNKNWYLPGGEALADEDLLSCVEHQVFSTAGLLINPGRLFSVFETFREDKKIHTIEHIFFSRFKEDTTSEDDSNLKFKMPYHQFFTLEQIVCDQNIYPRFLEYGNWLTPNKSNVMALYQGVV